MRNKRNQKLGIIVAAVASGLILATAALANNLVYRPLNPSFGGDPNMYAWLFGLADAQNMFTGTNGGAGNGGGAGGGTGGIGGPVIIINPGSTSVNPPSVSTEAEVQQIE